MNSQEKLFFESFRNVVRIIHSTLDIKEVMQILVSKVAEVMNVKGCSIRLLETNRGTLELISFHGLSEKYIGKGPVDANLSIAEAMEGKTVFIADATKDPRVQYNKEASEEGICSILSVPLSVKGHVIGVLRLYTSEPRTFSKEEIDFLEALVEMGAIAIENAKRYENIKKDYEYAINDIFNFFEYRRCI